MTRAQYDAVRGELDRAVRYLATVPGGKVTPWAAERALSAVRDADAILSQCAPVVVCDAPTRCAGPVGGPWSDARPLRNVGA